jgi:hypothetical protein
VAAGGTALTGYNQTLPALYGIAIDDPSDFNDIVQGNNGYHAGAGYDLVTGLGTPNAKSLVPDLAAWGTITPTSASTAEVGKSYYQAFSATWGSTDKNLSLTVNSGSLSALGLTTSSVNNGVAVGGVPTASGIVTFTVIATDPLGFTTTQSYTLQVYDTVESVVINDGSAQRSMVNSITVTFSGIVNLMPGAFQLTNQTTGGAEGISWATSTVNNRTVAVIAFSGSDIIGGSLADGRYTLTTNGADIQNQSGLAVDAAGSGQAGTTRTDGFFRLFGDITGSGTVTNADALAFVQAYRNRVYLWYFDYFGLGTLSVADLTQLQTRLGKTV